MARKISVEIVGDSRKLERAFGRSSRAANKFNRDIGKSSRGLLAGAGLFQSLGRSVAFASGAFLGGYGLTAAVRGAFEEMSSAEQATADMNAALKSTRGVANVTGKDIDTLSNSLMNLSGVDDELIKQSQTLLLTFTNIRNYAGKNNDVFTQAAKAALDLSVRFKEDLATAAVQVGKALNDPIRGVTALRRIGVSFTDAQAKLIKKLVESGNLLGAQRIILRELRKETGGAAKALGDTLGGKLNILRQNLTNVAGAIAQTLNPEIKRLTDRAIKWIQNTENQRRVVNAFREVGKAIGRIVGVLQNVIDMLGGVKNTIRDVALAWLFFKAKGIGAAAAVSIANVGAAATVKAAWRAALISTGFGALAVAAGLAAEYVITHWEKVKVWFDNFWRRLRESAVKAALAVVEPFTHIPTRLFNWARDAKDAMQKELASIETEPIRRGAAKVGAAFADGLEKGAKSKQPGRRKLPQFVPGPAVKDAKDAAKKQADAVEKAREKAREEAQKRAEAAQRLRDLREERQQRFLETGSPFVPSVKKLKDQLAQVRKALGSAIDPATRTRLNRIAKILAGAFGAVGKAMREQLKSELDGMRKDVDQGTVHVARAVKLNTQKILAGLGLTPEQRKALSGRLSEIGPGGTVPGLRPIASAAALGGGGGVVITGDVHFHGVQNLRDMEEQLYKRHRGRARTRRGA